MDNINIAIIDDGINEKFYNIGDLKYNIEITSDLRVIERRNYNKYLPSHATTCAAIIHKYSPQVCISSIKVLNDDRRGLREQLIMAIEWCIEKEIKIINLSLGTVYYNDCFEIHRVVNKAVKKGIVIVAACSNRSIITYPSYFSNVIGVKCDLEKKLKEGEYTYNYYPNDGIDITAYSRHLLYRYTGEGRFTEECNSYATPLVTSHIYNIIREKPGVTFDELKLELVEGALNKHEESYKPYLYKELDWIEKAVVFRLNGSKYNDVKLPYVFKTDEIIDLECKCLCLAADQIKNYFNRSNSFKNADTIVIDAGNVLSKHSQCTGELLIEDILDSGKNIVYIDDREIEKELGFRILKPCVKIWHPSVFNYLSIPVMKEIDVPMLGVSDFTGGYLPDLIYKLQECFRKDGYNVVSASDTCLGMLYGVNYAPLFSNSILSEFDPGGLKTLCGLYDPDVLIYGINAYDKDIDYLNHKGKSFEVDIDIIISDNYSNNVKEYISSCTKEGGQFILLIPASVVDIESRTDQSVKIFDLSSDGFVNEIYRYVIDLYDN